MVIGTLGRFLVAKSPSSSAAHELFFGLNYLVVPLGLGWYAHTKGRSIAWGFLGLIFFIGPLVALLTLGFRTKPSVTTEKEPFINVPSFLGWVMAVIPLVGAAYSVEYFIRGSRRMAFQALVQAMAGLVGFLIFRYFNGIIGPLFWLIIPLTTLHFSRTLDWPHPTPLAKVKGGSSIATIIFVVAVVGLLAAIAIPQMADYLKRSHTSDAMDHVKSIHQALVEWQGDSELADGAFPVMGDAMEEQEEAFSEAFSEEWNWLTNGGEHYDYSFKVEAGEDGRKTPKVTATAKNADGVYAETVVSLPNGVVELK